MVTFLVNSAVKCSVRNNIVNYTKKIKSNMSWSVHSMRSPYKRPHQSFTADQLVAKEPIAQFAHWFEEAKNTPAIIEPNAMCLATCTRSGIPSARFVLLKEFSMDGFKFFTNYSSRKGEELAENPRAALVFYWECLHRSVRVEGVTEKLSKEESTIYFQSRPKESQIGTTVSHQSKPVQHRDVLEHKQGVLEKKYEKADVLPKPDEWGGYILKPNSVEFWQGQSNRIHDRIRFRIRKENEIPDNTLLYEGTDGWVYEILQP